MDGKLKEEDFSEEEWRRRLDAIRRSQFSVSESIGRQGEQQVINARRQDMNAQEIQRGEEFVTGKTVIFSY